MCTRSCKADTITAAVFRVLIVRAVWLNNKKLQTVAQQFGVMMHSLLRRDEPANRLRFLAGTGERTSDVAAAQAAGADVHTLRSAVDHNADILNIGSPDAVGLTVGVADVMTVQRTLAANFAILTHGNPPPCWSMHTSKPCYYSTALKEMQGAKAGIYKEIGHFCKENPMC